MTAKSPLIPRRSPTLISSANSKIEMLTMRFLRP